jgi:L-asparaginase II
VDPETKKGMGLTVKMEDGGERGRNHIPIAILQKFGVLPNPLPANLTQFAEHSLFNWAGLEIGEIKVRL